LQEAPFNLQVGDSVFAKIYAYNSIGDSLASTPGNGALIVNVVVPDAPTNVLRDEVQTTTSQIGLTWTDGANNGGSQIIDYRVSFDQGTGNWIVLQTGITTKAYIKTALQQGTRYTFRVEARNAIGYSLPSEEVEVLCAMAPPKMTAPITSVSVNSLVI